MVAPGTPRPRVTSRMPSPTRVTISTTNESASGANFRRACITPRPTAWTSQNGTPAPRMTKGHGEAVRKTSDQKGDAAARTTPVAMPAIRATRRRRTASWSESPANPSVSARAMKRAATSCRHQRDRRQAEQERHHEVRVRELGRGQHAADEQVEDVVARVRDHHRDGEHRATTYEATPDDRFRDRRCGHACAFAMRRSIWATCHCTISDMGMPVAAAKFRFPSAACLAGSSRTSAMASARLTGSPGSK